MAKSANTFTSLKPIYKESYAGPQKKKKRGHFDKLRKKLLDGYKPKKVGM